MKDEGGKIVSLSSGCKHPPRILPLLFVGSSILLSASLLSPATAEGGQQIGINVRLNEPPTESILQDLATHGRVLDVIPQINGVTMRAEASEVSTVQALPYVEGANPDA